MKSVIGYATWIVTIKDENSKIVDEIKKTEVVGHFKDVNEFYSFTESNRINDTHEFSCIYNNHRYTATVNSYDFTYSTLNESIEWKPMSQQYILLTAANMRISTSSAGILNTTFQDYRDLDE